MALGVQHDFEMHQGDDREITFTVVEEDGTTTINITGGTFTWVLSAKDADAVTPRGAALVTKTVGGGIVLVDAPNGGVRVDVGPGDTDTLQPGVYYQEVQMVLGGKTSTVLFGAITIRKDIA